jgi:large subunit ribosomal protein L17
MRHSVRGRKLGRTASHRAATLRLLATALFKHKKIKTTLAKAKELKKFAEPMITRAKNDSVHAKRIIAADIQDRAIVKELFTDIVAKIGDRPGGYTRVVRLGQRKGDGAEMAIIELVDYSGVVKPKATKKVKEEEKPAETKSEAPKEEKKEKKAAKPKAEKAEKKPAKAKAKKETDAEPKEKKTKKASKKAE